MKNKRVCPHWQDHNGSDDEREWCRAADAPCACCGDKGECEHPMDAYGEQESER
jgi:hypothetical protein